jgi:hypothetical protein
MATWPPSGRMYVNDRDLADFKMYVAHPKGFLSSPGISGEAVQVPGRAGQARAPGERSIGPLRFTVAGTIRAASTTEAEDLWGRAKQLLTQEDFEVWFGWWPDRIGLAHYEDIQWIEVPGHTRGAHFQLTLEMDNPRKYSRYYDVYTIPRNTEVALELGNAPSDVDLELIGMDMENPTVYYYDAQGLLRGNVSFDYPLPAGLPEGNFIRYDGAYQLARRYYVNNGILWNEAPELYDDPTLGFSRLFVADPNDGDGVSGPVLEAVNCDAIAYIRKAWL